MVKGVKAGEIRGLIGGVVPSGLRCIAPGSVLDIDRPEIPLVDILRCLTESGT
jgi:hypothetical protein